MSNPLISVYKKSRQERIESGDLATDGAVRFPRLRFLYECIFGVVGVIAALLVAHAADLFVEKLSPGAAAFLVSMVATLAIVMLFQSIFLREKKIQRALVIVEIALILSRFIDQFSLWFLSGIILFIVITLLGMSFAKRSLDDSFRVHFVGYAYRFLSAFFNGFTLFVACATVGLYQNAGGISERALALLYRGSAPLIEATFGIPLAETTTVSGALSSYVGAQLTHLPDFAVLTPTQRAAHIAGAVVQVQSQIASRTGVKPQAQETVLAYVYRLLDAGLSKIRGGEFGWSALLSLFVLGALLVKSLLFILKFPTLLVALVLYRICLWTKVLRISVETRDKEVLFVSR